MNWKTFYLQRTKENHINDQFFLCISEHKKKNQQANQGNHSKKDKEKQVERRTLKESSIIPEIKEYL